MPKQLSLPNSHRVLPCILALLLLSTLTKFAAGSLFGTQSKLAATTKNPLQHLMASTRTTLAPTMVSANTTTTDPASPVDNTKKQQQQPQKQQPEKELTEQWWPTFWGNKKSKDTKTSGKDKDVKPGTPQKPVVSSSSKNATSTAVTKKKSSKPKKSKQKKASSEETANKNEDQEIALNKDDSQNTTATETDSTTTTADATNTTKSDAKKKAPPSQTGVGTHPIVLMGGPAAMGAAAGGFRSPQQLQQQQQQMRNTATTLAAAEVVGVMIGNCIRLVLLMWGTRYFATRQESIHPTQHFVFERLNDFFVRDSLALQTALDEAPQGISAGRWRRTMARRRGKFAMSSTGGPATAAFPKRPKLDSTFVKTVIVIEFGNDGKGNLDLKYLANIVSFLLTQHQLQSFGSVQEEIEVKEGGKKTTKIISKPVELEIVFKIDSPGGSVTSFGLAAAQVERLRRVKGITTTACVDKYAASGGYMIASQAHKMVAAPFATVGSVGVIMETLNFHDLLRSYGVQPLVLKAGEAKVPLTTFGAVTKSDMEMEQEHLEKVHGEFQKFTVLGRPQLKNRVKEVCNGSVYMGKEALSLNLVDDIMTSDEYLMEKMQNGDRVLKIHKSQQSRMGHNVRFPSFTDILPHLKGRIESWMSNPETAARLLQTGSFVGFVVHFLSNRIGKPPSP